MYYTYTVTTLETTRSLELTESLTTLTQRTVEEIEHIFNLDHKFTPDDFTQWYEIEEKNNITGEEKLLKHFDTGFVPDTGEEE